MAEWIGIGLIAIGLIVSIVTNGRSKSEEYGALKRDVKNIKDNLTEDVKGINTKLDDPIFGLNAIHMEMANFRTHCAEVSGRLAGKVEALEKSRRK